MKDAPRHGLELFANRIEARSVLAPDERQAILDLPGQVATVKTNAELVRLGQVVDRTCLVVDGLMARFSLARNGARQISAFYIPGDMPDLHSFVMPRATSALVGLAPTTVLRVPHAAIAAVTERFPKVATALWRDCTMDAALTAEWLLNLSRRSAQSRTAHLFCEMAVRYGQIGAFEDLHFPFPITQTHLADAVGLTSVHVNRTLKKLKDGGIVRVTRSQVTVLDWQKLTAIAEFDPSYLQLDVRH